MCFFLHILRKENEKYILVCRKNIEGKVILWVTINLTRHKCNQNILYKCTNTELSINVSYLTIFVYALIPDSHTSSASRVLPSDSCHFAMYRVVPVFHSSTFSTMSTSQRGKSIWVWSPPSVTPQQTRGDIRKAISCPTSCLCVSAKGLPSHSVSLTMCMSLGDSKFTGLPTSEKEPVGEQESLESAVSSVYSCGLSFHLELKYRHRQWWRGTHDPRADSVVGCETSEHSSSNIHSADSFGDRLSCCLFAVRSIIRLVLWVNKANAGS